jgi:hypothetical protein
MKCVGNSQPKSLGEIERKTYGTGGLIAVPDKPIGRCLVGGKGFPESLIPRGPTTNGHYTLLGHPFA